MSPDRPSWGRTRRCRPERHPATASARRGAGGRCAPPCRPPRGHCNDDAGVAFRARGNMTTAEAAELIRSEVEAGLDAIASESPVSSSSAAAQYATRSSSRLGEYLRGPHARVQEVVRLGGRTGPLRCVPSPGPDPPLGCWHLPCHWAELRRGLSRTVERPDHRLAPARGPAAMPTGLEALTSHPVGPEPMCSARAAPSLGHPRTP